jgi:hypothetical protein
MLLHVSMLFRYPLKLRCAMENYRQRHQSFLFKASLKCASSSQPKTRSLVPVLAPKGDQLRLSRCRRCLLDVHSYLDAIPKLFRCFDVIFDALPSFDVGPGTY